MGFVTAFILGGVLCAVFQVILMFTPLDPPKILIGGLLVGGIATAFGLADVLAAWGGAGFSVMVVGAAQAMFGSVQAILAGNFIPLCVLLGVFAALTILGSLAGWIYAATHKDGESGEA